MPRAKPPAGSRVLDRGGAPIAWYPLLAPGRTFAGDSGDVPDLMGRSAAGARSGDCAWVAGPAGPSLSFGSTGYVALPTPTSLGIGALGVPFSLAYSFRYSGGGGILAGWYDGSHLFHLNIDGSGNLYQAAYGSGSFTSMSVGGISPGVWYRGVFTFDAASVGRLYLDGRLVATASAATGAFGSSTAINWGRRGGDGASHLAGASDDLRVYPYALTAAEVARDVADPWRRLRRGTHRAARFIQPSVQTIAPAAIASAESFGTATLAGRATIAPAAIATAEAFGSSTVTAAATLAPAAIASAESFGVATLDLQLVVNVALSAALLADDVSNPFDGIDPGYTVESTG